jgi:GNAT superfamily N-acetyltransferase
MSIRIRTYKHHNDYARVLTLAELMHGESKYTHKTFMRENVYEFLEGIDNNTLIGYIAEHDQRGIVGFICLTQMPYIFTGGFFVHDLAFYIMPEMRHTLAFAALLRAAESYAKSAGADAVMLGITAPHDVTKAARAYSKRGYQTFGVFMRKEIVT